MQSIGKPTRTRVLRARNTRAVRISKSVALPVGQVFIEQRGGGLFISSLRGRWNLFFSERGVDFPVTAAQFRDKRLPREVNLDWTGKLATPVKQRTRSRRNP
jgi:virulence-associated protein VagC